MADVDGHVLHNLRTLFAYGAMDRPAYAEDEAAIDQAAHHAAARRIAEAGDRAAARTTACSRSTPASSTRSP